VEKPDFPEQQDDEQDFDVFDLYEDAAFADESDEDEHLYI
jgi:hypothetical protein